MRSLSRASGPLIAAAAVILGSVTGSAQDAKTFYAGKTDQAHRRPAAWRRRRCLCAHRAAPSCRHIPGAPRIVTQNMPGAGSLRSVMGLAASPDDGTVMAHFSSGLLTEAITSPDRVKVDFRNFAWLGNVSEDVRVCYLRSASGVRTWPDMLARNEVIFGATAAGNAGNVDTAMLRNLFGVKLKQVSGYAGSADKRLAVESGEIDGDCGGWTSVPDDWLRDHKINVMVRLSPTLVPGMDNERAVRRRPREGRQRAQDLRFPHCARAARAAVHGVGQGAGRSRGGAAQGVRRDGGRPGIPGRSPEDPSCWSRPMTGDEVARQVGELYATPPELVTRAKAITAE